MIIYIRNSADCFDLHQEVPASFAHKYEAASIIISGPRAADVIKPTLKYFYHFWSGRLRILLVNCVLPTPVRGVSLSGVFSWAALSPVQSRLLFSFMKINETVQSSAEASRALLTEEAFGLRQAAAARCHGSSERVRGNILAQRCSRNDNREEDREGIANAECQS